MFASHPEDAYIEHSSLLSSMYFSPQRKAITLEVPQTMPAIF